MGVPFFFGVTRMSQDTLIVCLSDLHSGSSVALFPDRLYKFNLERNHTPTENQKRMYKHWIRCAVHARNLRKGKRLIIIHNGDAIDGWHHGTHQVLTSIPDEQADLHKYLMRRFLKNAGFDPGAGDKLIYIKGTEVHTGETEEKIAFDLGAEYKIAPDFVELSINGKLIWFFHHGPNSGDGHTAGNTLRNWLARLYWDRVNYRRILPNLVVTGHYHKATYNSYVQQRDDGIHVMHGLILPSWQMKTRFAYRVVPVSQNKIGAAYIEVTASGGITEPSFMLWESANGVSLSV